MCAAVNSCQCFCKLSEQLDLIWPQWHLWSSICLQLHHKSVGKHHTLHTGQFVWQSSGFVERTSFKLILQSCTFVFMDIHTETEGNECQQVAAIYFMWQFRRWLIAELSRTLNVKNISDFRPLCKLPSFKLCNSTSASQRHLNIVKCFFIIHLTKVTMTITLWVLFWDSFITNDSFSVPWPGDSQPVSLLSGYFIASLSFAVFVAQVFLIFLLTHFNRNQKFKCKHVYLLYV